MEALTTDGAIAPDGGSISLTGVDSSGAPTKCAGYRRVHPDVGLAEAKAAIEAMKTQQ